MPSHAMIPYREAAQNMSVEKRMELLRAINTVSRQKTKARGQKAELKHGLLQSGGNLAAGLISGYLFSSTYNPLDPKNPTGADYRPVANIPAEWLGAAAGIGLGGLMAHKLGKAAPIVKAVGDGFLTVAGLKLGVGFGSKNSKDPFELSLMNKSAADAMRATAKAAKTASAGDDGYSGLDDASGDGDLIP